jgi:uncharacterized protein YdeI (YjbR/CyaY-like superfamily)
METFKDLPVLHFETADKFAEWLDKNYSQPAGVWLKLAKKKTGAKSVSYTEALDAALCYGGIDGQVQKYDEQFYLQKFTPRRDKSIWSVRNTQKAEALIAAGKMKPAGLAAINQAKADGRWDTAYHSSSTFTMPKDFLKALKSSPKASEFYESLNASNKYAIYFQIQTASDKARPAKIDKLIKMLEQNKKIHP